jgi:hypothetical protein
LTDRSLIRRIATVFLAGGLAVACGDGGGGGGGEPDAGDGSSDGSNVTVVVSVGGTPLVDIDVVFHAPDGAVTAHATTDAAGEARATIVAGSQVTIARAGPGGDADLTTYRSIEPGDTVRQRYRDYTSLAMAEVTLPGEVADAYQYFVGNGCDSPEDTTAELTASLAIDASCVGGSPPAFPLYAVAVSESGDSALAWSLAPSVPVSSPDAILPAWETDFDTVTVNLVNLPPDILFLTAQGGFRIGAASFTVTGGLVFASPSGDQTGAIVYSQLLASSYAIATNIAYGESSSAWLEEGRAEASPERTVDLDGMLPRLSGATRNGTTERPGVSWTGSAPDADALAVDLHWSGGRWLIYDAPEEAGEVQTPALPDALAAYRPLVDIEGGSINFFDADWVDGYEGIKAAGDELSPEDGDWRIARTSALLE